MSQVDVRRGLKYPPEVFMGTVIMDLSEGLNNIISYTGLDVARMFMALTGFSTTPASNVALDITRDGQAGYVVVSDLGAVRGLDYLEELRVGCLRSLTVRARAISTVSNFTFRYLVKASPVKPVHKLLYGATLTPREREVAEKVGLEETIKSYPVEVWNPYKGVLDVKYQSMSVSASGMLLRVTPPAGFKAVLLGLTCDRPSAPNSYKMHVSRDGIEDVMVLDAYGMSAYSAWWGSPPWSNIRLIALDELIVEAEVISGGPYRTRIVYGLAPLTIAEKIVWGIELTAGERSTAEKHKLFDLVEAGVLP